MLKPWTKEHPIKAQEQDRVAIEKFSSCSPYEKALTLWAETIVWKDHLEYKEIKWESSANKHSPIWAGAKKGKKISFS